MLIRGVLLSVSALLGAVALASCSSSGETCGTTLLGGEMCGAKLTAWCADNYNPDLNGDLCEKVLREDGQDPDAVLADVKAREKQEVDAILDREMDTQRRADETAALTARITTKPGKPTRLGDFTVTVAEPRYEQSVGTEYDTQKARPGRRFAVVDVNVRNDGRKPVSACAYESATLTDDTGRTFSAASAATTSASGYENCEDDLQPGDDLTLTVVFELRDSVTPASIQVWAPDGYGTDTTQPHLHVDL